MHILLNNPLSGLHKSSFNSIYFGGGTPSLMPPSLIERVLKALAHYIPIAEDCEITMETDPGKLHTIITIVSFTPLPIMCYIYMYVYRYIRFVLPE